MTEVELNPSQKKALEEIEGSIIMRRHHLLAGNAGTGKTTLVQEIAKHHHAKGDKIVLTAPTHKAVAVLERKLKLAGIAIPCRTIHSLLSLKPKPQGDKQVFVRGKNARPVQEDIIIIDEASMLDASMMGTSSATWIRARCCFPAIPRNCRLSGKPHPALWTSCPCRVWT